MALTARLQFGDNDARVYHREYLVVNCHCHFSRSHNHFHPEGDARCERMELTVVPPGKENLGLYEWYITGDSVSGRLVFDLSMNPGFDELAAKDIYFEDAYCYSLQEEYRIDKAQRRQLRLSIIAEKITINDVSFVNPYQ